MFSCPKQQHKLTQLLWSKLQLLQRYWAEETEDAHRIAATTREQLRHSLHLRKEPPSLQPRYPALSCSSLVTLAYSQAKYCQGS